MCMQTPEFSSAAVIRLMAGIRPSATGRTMRTGSRSNRVRQAALKADRLVRRKCSKHFVSIVRVRHEGVIVQLYAVRVHVRNIDSAKTMA
jgi:hypothetical protein